MFFALFFMKKGCQSAHFSVNYGADFLALKSDILTLFEIKNRGLL
jgi:hypothetical protein